MIDGHYGTPTPLGSKVQTCCDAESKQHGVMVREMGQSRKGKVTGLYSHRVPLCLVSVACTTRKCNVTVCRQKERAQTQLSFSVKTNVVFYTTTAPQEAKSNLQYY